MARLIKDLIEEGQRMERMKERAYIALFLVLVGYLVVSVWVIAHFVVKYW